MIVAFQVLVMVCCAFLIASLSSFLGVVAERSITNQGVGGRSSCACGRPLRWYENVPVVGWLRVKGVAKCCGFRIPSFLVVTESLAAASGAVTGLLFFNRLVVEGSSNAPVLFAVSFSFALLLSELLVMHAIVNKNPISKVTKEEES